MKGLRSFLLLGAVVCFVLFVIVQLNNNQAAAKELEEVKAKIQLTTEVVETVEASEEEVIEVEEVVEEAFEAPAHIGEIFSEEGADYGVISLPSLNKEAAIVVGTTDSSLEHTAMLHAYSTEDEMVILGHEYANGDVFGCLPSIEEGDEVVITTLDGAVRTFVVSSFSWVSEEEYEAEGYAASNIFNQGNDLTLITCHKQDGTRGRFIALCEEVK